MAPQSSEKERAFYINIGCLDGRRQALLIYRHASREGAALRVTASADSLDALASAVGNHYHAITNTTSTRFVDAYCPSAAWEGKIPSLRRRLSTKEFERFWEQVQAAYSHRDGFAPLRAA